MPGESDSGNRGLVNAIGNSLLEFILSGRLPLSSRSYYEVKAQADQLIILPMRIISLLVALFGLLAMVFEIKYYPEHSVPIYITRLTATVIAFLILTALSTPLARLRSVLLVHILLLTIIVSSGLMIFLLPNTLLVNSGIVGLLIFTAALFFSWEVKNQIIVAIYYNIVFALAILLNDRIIYFLPNVAESVIFVIAFSMISIIACAINFRMRLILSERNLEVEMSEKKFRSIIENSSEGIFQSSLEGNWLTLNDSFANILGYDNSEELLNINVKDIYVDSEERTRLLKALKENKKVENYRLRLRKKDGTIAIVNLNDRLVIAKDGRGYFEGTISDITAQVKAEEDRKKAEEALKFEKEKSERLAKQAMQFSEMKSKFLANMSHEIRTPITGVLGFLTLIESGAYSDINELKQFSSNARQSAESLLEIINSILDLSRIEAGKVWLDNVNFNLNDVISQSLAVISTKAAEKGITIVKEIQPDIITYLNGDSTKIRQVLINLLSNAVKFTSKGEIRLSVDSEAVSADEVILSVFVSDTGLGIPADKLDSLFKPYSQIKGADDNRIGSSGLGLAICKEYVTLMGGEISVESEAGKGSTFHFKIRCKVQPHPMMSDYGESETDVSVKPSDWVSDLSASGNALREKRAKYHVLLAEDNLVNQAVSLKILSLAGYKADAVTDGAKAAEAVEKGNYDIVLMDIQMPEVDGFSATKKIRNLNSTKKGIPIIALTAHALMGDKDKCIKAGMNDYISKPIIGQALINKIDTLLEIHNNKSSMPNDKSDAKDIIFDRKRLNDVSLGDTEFENELLNSYLNDLEQKMENLSHLVSEQNLNKIVEMAHTIKGASYSVGAVKVGDEAYAIELSGKSNDLYSVNYRIGKLKAAISETKSEILKFIG